MTLSQYADDSPAKAEWAVLYTAAMGGRKTIEECKAQGVTADAFTDPVTRFGWEVLIAINRTEGALGDVEIAAVWDSEVERRVRSHADPKLRLNGTAFASVLFGDARHQAHPSTAETFAALIIERHDFRVSQQTIADWLEKARSWDATPAEYVRGLQAAVSGLKSTSSRFDHQWNEEYSMAYDAFRGAYGTHDGVRGLKTGFPQLDRYTKGMRGGDTIIIGGPTGGGKTVFGWQIVLNAALNGCHCLAYSLEMKFKDIIERATFATAKVSADDYTLGTLTREDFDRLDRAAERLSRCRIQMTDRFGASITDIEADARAKHYATPTDLILIDYAQLVQTGKQRGKAETERDDLIYVAQRAKVLAGDLNVPVVLLSQQNEEGHTAGSKKFEQDCSAYFSIDKSDMQLGIPPTERHIRERRTLKIRKARFGGGVDIPLLFYKDQQRFEEQAVFEDEVF